MHLTYNVLKAIRAFAILGFILDQVSRTGRVCGIRVKHASEAVDSNFGRVKGLRVTDGWSSYRLSERKGFAFTALLQSIGNTSPTNHRPFAMIVEEGILALDVQPHFSIIIMVIVRPHLRGAIDKKDEKEGKHSPQDVTPCRYSTTLVLLST